MTDRERLIELLGLYLPINVPSEVGGYATIGERTLHRDDREILADHLLANGVVVPPCRAGDTVYYLEGSRILEGTIKSLSAIMKDNYFVVYVETKYSLLGIERFGYWMFGKTIFLTREEAEKALKERETE